MLTKPAMGSVPFGRPRTPVAVGSMATQFSAMNSRQAKIARSWMLAPDPVGTSCGTLGLIKLGGRGTWADAGCAAGNAHNNCATTNKNECALDDRPLMMPPCGLAPAP